MDITLAAAVVHHCLRNDAGIGSHPCRSSTRLQCNVIRVTALCPAWVKATLTLAIPAELTASMPVLFRVVWPAAMAAAPSSSSSLRSMLPAATLELTCMARCECIERIHMMSEEKG